MWAYESVFYQIYPLGLCGAPYENDGRAESRILKIKNWIPHIKKLGANAVYFCPIFESDTHGYNTRDFFKTDVRLGTIEDFKSVFDALHENGIRVVIDGVFNHVGRGFWAFRDVCEKRENSPYLGWFNINLGGESNYGDHLWYEGWEGNYDLVKLNLNNHEVREHIFSAIRFWVEKLGIDGLRLDVAYLLGQDFIKELRQFTNGLKEDFFLLGEVLHTSNNDYISDSLLHSITNYSCYKGLYSSFNSGNMFEIIHSVKRLFDDEPWCQYKGTHMLSFLDNHDVSRIASVISDSRHLKLAYALMMGMPGIPSIYYGSEWGIKGEKSRGDGDLRPAVSEPVENELTDYISRLAHAKINSKALNYGSFRSILLTNKQCIFERRTDSERVLVAINAADEPYVAHFDAGCGLAREFIEGKMHDFGGGSELKPMSACYWLMEK